jgi:hypothetical protein
MRLGDYELAAPPDASARSVHRATHPTTDFPVLLDCLPKSQLATPDCRAAISALPALWHPFLCEAFQVVETADLLVVVWEEAPNGSLLAGLAGGAALPEALCRKYFAQVVSALEYLHCEKRVPHGSLAPGTVLLDRNSNVKLGDLGVSARLRGGPPDGAWLAPELRGGGAPTLAADVWAAGMLLLRIATGAAEWPAPLPRPLACLVAAMLAPDPDARIAVADIPAHPWVQSTQYWAFLSSRVREQAATANVFNRAAARRLAAAGVACDDLQRQVNRGEATDLTAAYRQIVRERVTAALKDLVEQQPGSKLGVRRGSGKTLGAGTAPPMPRAPDGPRRLVPPRTNAPRRTSVELAHGIDCTGQPRMLPTPLPLTIATRRVSRS